MAKVHREKARVLENRETHQTAIGIHEWAKHFPGPIRRDSWSQVTVAYHPKASARLGELRCQRYSRDSGVVYGWIHCGIPDDW